MKIGLQLYTLRHQCETPEALEESLRKVSEIGYRYVQVSGIKDYDPKQLKKLLRKYNLKCVLTHIPPEELQGDPDALCKKHDVLNCDYVGLGMYKFESENSIGEFLNTYLPVANALKKDGKLFMYHNHCGEFQKFNGKTVFDSLLEAIPADVMGFTYDTYWAQVGGVNPAEFLLKLKGRAPVIHLKDYGWEAAGTKDGLRMKPLGEGNINFDEVFKAAKKAGVRYMLVEQDQCYDEDPFDCIKRSYEFLKSKGFE